ncbi:MAG: carboxypeptidase-like regulatory domain-containing protein [Terriglobia bacterium]
MKVGWKVAGGIALVALIAGAVALIMVHRARVRKSHRTILLRGAVIQQDADPRKELPIAEVEISAADGLAARGCKSDSSGFFLLVLRPGVPPGQPVTLVFRHPGFAPLELNEIVGDKIYVARMTPIPHAVNPTVDHPEVVIANVRVRYSTKARSDVDVGSAVKAFQIVNTGNIPCYGRQPCSPDGKWKADVGSISLDVGEGNEFRNARVSCIAGPCPFTKIVSTNFSQNSRTLNVSALAWSDTTTFLLEAEVVRSAVNDIVRQSYPVIFGDALNFTLPGTAEGVSIEAEMNGTPILFPLGPDLLLSWGDCHARVNGDHTKVYRCELKSGYRFQ